MAKGEHIYLAGESTLIVEYCALCLRVRHSVTVRLNPQETARLPKGTKTALTPPKSVTCALELTNISLDTKQKNLIQLDRSLGAGIPIISSSTTVTVAEQAAWIRKPQRLIGIGALPSLLEGSVIEFAPAETTNEHTITRAREFAAALGKEAALVRDSIGLVMPRILCMLANEAYFAMMEGVASSRDIDTAMKLGTNYPTGPVERAGKIGVNQIYAILSALHKYFGEERYRIAPLLRQAAFASH